ncbi:hypothetical protein AB205_0202430 [Aquarana catesbeiana]|uniref:Uncharacterized protein n=1 Tax=Aquarana catesbeiana TaxID=8400 RepID=A0A2G9RDE7_AQUCT|nr:hypothetical protein AB205_0202430 [Aquarana catesbeiana]
MAETQQVHNRSNDEEESPEPETSRSSRRFKASNMSLVEMVEMVDILKRADYDGKYGPYTNPNERKAKIMTKVVKREQRLRKHEDTRDPPLPEEGEQRSQPEDVEEGEVVEINTTTGDVQVVVPKSSHFTSDSAQRLIQEILFCSRDLDLIKEKTKEIEQRLKNMINVLGRI